MVDEIRLEAAGIDYKIAMERFGDNEEIFEKFLCPETRMFPGFFRSF